MLSRDEELERNQGKWIAMNRVFKNKVKYNRKDKNKELRKELSSFLLFRILQIKAYGQISVQYPNQNSIL